MEDRITELQEDIQDLSQFLHTFVEELREGIEIDDIDAEDEEEGEDDEEEGDYEEGIDEVDEVNESIADGEAVIDVAESEGSDAEGDLAASSGEAAESGDAGSIPAEPKPSDD